MSENQYRTFEEFFKKATGHTPYPYQKRLAEGEMPDILDIPTGAGKTEAAVLCMWMWRRANDYKKNIYQSTPRRLVYCLPMRSLVEQTEERIKSCMERLKKDGLSVPHVVTIMGGDIDRDYVLHPEDDMIIIGTQDMLLSRALNRGYVSSQFRWPIEFGLLNNDCMWVMDEIQLMNNGLATSVQLDAFRNSLHTYGTHKTVWMSATINREQIDTADYMAQPIMFNINDDDHANGKLRQRNEAVKTMHTLELDLKKDSYKKSDVKKIINLHENGTMTLIMVNTVRRAQSLYKGIKEASKGHSEILLIHSRFRGVDRKSITNKLKEISSCKRDAIVISTQVVEAGIDISAKTLITELAPWSSLVQRFGRCNRSGKQDNASIHVIMLKPSNNMPYAEDEMEQSRNIVTKNEGRSMSPQNISRGKNIISGEQSIRKPDTVIRKPDIISLFDTTPDISGGYTDVSQYVRSSEETHDVHVFWRTWKKGGHPPNYKINNDEVCSVPIGDMKKEGAYTYDHVEGLWKETKTRDLHPGQTALLHSDYGCYTEDMGWDMTSNKSVTEMIHGDGRDDAVARDPQSKSSKLLTLSEHTINVVNELKAMHDKISYGEEKDDKKTKNIMRKAAILHDLGKAHDVFQNAIPNRDKSKIWGKSGASMKTYSIRNFRHEAVSAMAILKMAGKKTDLANSLLAYVVASHHGKVRMSMRNSSGRVLNGTIEYIAGIPTNASINVSNFLAREDTDKHLKMDDWSVKTFNISADIARVGETVNGVSSWLQMTTALLREHGPFKLAYLESVLRAADSRASAKEKRL